MFIVINKVFWMINIVFKSSGWWFPSFPCSPCSPCSPNLLHVLPSRMARLQNLWSLGKKMKRVNIWQVIVKATFSTYITYIYHGDDVRQRGCSRENLIFLSVGTSLKLGFCGKPNWAQRLNGNISHNFQCILSGNSNFPTFHRHLGILGSGWISIWAACHIFGKYYIFEN